MKSFLSLMCLSLGAFVYSGDTSVRVNLSFGEAEATATLRNYYPTIIEKTDQNIVFEIFAKAFDQADQTLIAVQINEYDSSGKYKNVAQLLIEDGESITTDSLSIPVKITILNASQPDHGIAMASQCCLTCDGWTYCGCAV